MSSGRTSIRSAILLTGLAAATLPLAAQGGRNAPPPPRGTEPSRPAAPAPASAPTPAPTPAAAAPAPRAAEPSRTAAEAKAADPNGPREGTWGAEVGSSGLDIRFPQATLLRFMSPTLALTVGGAAGLTTGDESTSAFQLRLGVRRYGARPTPLRPIIGGGVVASVLTLGGQLGNETAIGAYGEVGAAYFFSPHVSLGATGELAITSESGNGQSTVNFRMSLVRMLAAVYF